MNLSMRIARGFAIKARRVYGEGTHADTRHHIRSDKRTHWRIVYDPCDVQLSPDLRLNKDELRRMLYARALLPGTIVANDLGEIRMVEAYPYGLRLRALEEV